MSPQYLSPGVYVEEVDKGSKPIEGVGTAVAGFVGFAGMGPVNKPTFIANWTQYTNTFGGFVPGAYLAHAVYGYFNNGGGSCYVLRLPTGGEPASANPTAALPAKAAGAPTTLRAVAREGGAAGEGITLDVADAGDDKFNLTVRRGTVEEKYEGVSLSSAKGAQNVVDTVNKQSKLVLLEDMRVAGAAVADRAPTPGSYALRPVEAQSLTVKATSPDLYQGNVADRSGLGGFEAIDDITMVACPDLMAAYQAGGINREGVKAVQLALIAHCENMKDRVAIIDPLPDMSAQEVKDWRMKEAGFDSKYAVLYYPWIQVANPNPGADGTSMFIPPSGHLAGIWARSDTDARRPQGPGQRGHPRRAGLARPDHQGRSRTASTRSASTASAPSPAAASACGAPAPCRAIRPGATSTCAGCSTSSKSRSCSARNGWCSSPTTRPCGSACAAPSPRFLTRVWRDGALFGTTPEEAFYVKCDAENNPPRRATWAS